MGIHGFTSFMNNTYLESILEDFQLKNCFLLIDTNSLMHNFNTANNLKPFYGGNYDQLAAKLNDLFDIFQKCNIKPIFLFDGGREMNDRKFSTQLNRSRSRLQEVSGTLDSFVNKKKKINSESLLNSAEYPILNRILPIKTFEIFIDMLKAHKFMHYQCIFEADYELACLSNLLKCPILSCDSDFLVYDLKYGYISSDFIELNTNKLINEINDRTLEVSEADPSAQFYIPVKIYKLKNFLNEFNSRHSGINLKVEMLSIFAVLMGNDYVDSNIFISLMSSLNPSNNNLKFKKLPKNNGSYKKQKFRHNEKVLEWLGLYETTDQCVQEILNFVKCDQHKLIKRVISENMDEYLCRKPSLATYFLNKINNEEPLEIVDNGQLNKEAMTFDKQQLDFEFLSKFTMFELCRVSINVLIHRKLIYNAQIEVIDWPSTWLSSQNIRKIFYSILINRYEKETANDVLIEEYLRFKKQIKIYRIPLDDRKLYQNLSSIDDHFIFTKCLNVTQNAYDSLMKSSLNKKLKIFYVILEYWLKWYDDSKWYNNAQFKENNAQFKELFEVKNLNCRRAFIVSLIKCSIVDVCYLKFRTGNANSSGQETIRVIKDIQKNELLNNKDYMKSEGLIDDINKHILSEYSNNEYIKEISSKFKTFTHSISFNHSQMKKSSEYKLGRLFNLPIIHCLCEFQSIYLSLSYVKDTLKSLEPGIDSADLLSMKSFFNGTFLHNLIEELNHRKSPDLYIEELFGRKSLLKYVYAELMNSYDQVFGDDLETKFASLYLK